MTEDTKSSKKPIPSPPGIRFDWRDWLHFFEDDDSPIEEKKELIETLFVTVMGFVDLGYELNPSVEFCGEVIDLTAILQAHVLDSDKSKPAFNAAGGVPADLPARGDRT